MSPFTNCCRAERRFEREFRFFGKSNLVQEDQPMEIIQRFASFIANTGSSAIPAKAIELCKRNILDCIGVTLAGTKTEAGRIIREFVAENVGSSRSGVIAGNFKTSPSMAALANGTMAHALDYDDINSDSVAHPSVSLLPALCAVAEDQEASGRKIIEAYILGYEIEDRMGLCLNPEHYDLGWHTTGTLGTFGAMTAASRILSLNEEQVQIAFGIAASLMGGSRKNFGTMTKPLHAGNSAKNGVIAASLAKRGFTASPEILEGPMGVLDLFSPGKNVDPSKIAALLGNPFAILSPGTFIKPYPCCGGGHGSVDAMLQLIRSHGLSRENVEKIECGVFYRIPTAMIYHRPKSGLEGKFSLEYCLAAALVDGKVGLDQFTDERVNDPSLQEMLRKVTVYVPPELKTKESFEKRFAEVTVHTKDGRVLKKKVHSPIGNPENPLSDAEVEEKFKDCAKSVLNKNEISRVIELVYNLGKVEDIGELMEIITFRTN
jgi:2-methylcitrate dehydratase PrpD